MLYEIFYFVMMAFGTVIFMVAVFDRARDDGCKKMPLKEWPIEKKSRPKPKPKPKITANSGLAETYVHNYKYQTPFKIKVDDTIWAEYRRDYNDDRFDARDRYMARIPIHIESIGKTHFADDTNWDHINTDGTKVNSKHIPLKWVRKIDGLLYVQLDKDKRAKE